MLKLPCVGTQVPSNNAKILLGEKRQVHRSHVASNKYIVLSIRTCATHDKSHNSQLK